MQFHREVLPNGLTIVGETSPSARSVALGFWVRTGARDETPEVSGVTHFLEHMIFKGSDQRDALSVNRDLDRIGASPNAFTSEENTVFHAAVLPEYLFRAVDILADILRPTLRVEDFTTEKEVIIEEIGKYEDQPGYVAYEKARELFYGTHKLGNSVLGTVASIRALTRDQMYEYFRRRYVAPNITLSAAGNFDWPRLVELVEKHCGQWEAGPIGREGIGAYFTSFSCEPEQAEENLATVRRILAEVQQDGITEEELRRAKTKIQSHLVRASERSHRRMLDLGAAWTYLGKFRSIDDELNDYEAVTRASIREVLDRYPLTRAATLALGPLPSLSHS